MTAVDCEYVFKEYQILWNHYQKTLDERNNMLKNYYLLIGIPSTALALLPYHSILSEGISGLLLLVTVLGILFSFTYVSECITADCERYIFRVKPRTSAVLSKF